MQGTRKTWFLAPGDDITPDAVHLGCILQEPQDLKAVLDAGLLRSSAIDMHVDTHPSTQFNVTRTFTSGHTNGLGIGAQFLSLVGLDADASFRVAKDITYSMTFDKVDCQWFSPSIDFLKKSMESETMRMWLEENRGKIEVFMVTGLRIATGITLQNSRKQSHDASAHVQVTPAPGASPITVGPHGVHARQHGSENVMEAPGPLVYAYELRRVKVKKGKVTSQWETKGALFDNVGGKEPYKLDVEVDEDFEPSLREAYGFFNGRDEVNGDEDVLVAASK